MALFSHLSHLEMALPGPPLHLDVALPGPSPIPGCGTRWHLKMALPENHLHLFMALFSYLSHLELALADPAQYLRLTLPSSVHIPNL